MKWLESLMNLPAKVWLIVALFVVLFVFGLAHRAHAEDGWVQVSGGGTIVRGPAPVADLGFTWPARHNDFWKADLTLVGSSHYGYIVTEDCNHGPTCHLVYTDMPAPNNFIVRGLYVTGFGHFDLGLGVSWMQNYLPYNGGNVNLNLEMAYRFQRLPITFTYSHFSDAGSKLPNYGRDLVMLGWRF